MKKGIQYALILFGIFCLFMMLSCGLIVEFYYHQQPCLLCKIQRAAASGIALGLFFHLRYGIELKYYGFSFLWALFGLLASLRHMGLNVCEKSGEGPFLFLSHPLYFWSFVAFIASMVGLVLLLFLYEEGKRSLPSLWMICIGGTLLLVPLILNTVSVIFF